jgi:hypothetical protein
MLLDDIIELLGDEKHSLTTAMLKTKILLHQIGKKELVGWVNNELNGYPEGGDVPSYRILNSHVTGNVANMAARYTALPIPIGHLKEEQQQTLQKSRMWQSLSVLETMVKDSKNGRLRRPIPMEFNGLLGQQFDNGFHIESAWCEIQTHEIEGVFAQVRSRLLDFMLELRDSVGELKTDDDLKTKTTGVDSTGMFKNAIFGDNTTIVVGDNNQQNITNFVKQGDMDALIQVLSAAGLSTQTIEEMKTAVKEDEKESGHATLAGKTGTWFTQLLGKAGKGVADVGVDIVSSTISKALTSYIGSV